MGIPEPTRSLLFITNEPLSKIQSPLQIKLVITVDGIEEEKSEDFFFEPSLIWTRLPIQKNDDLETEKMYYPSYSGLSPRCRYQYLNWLKDITQETNLSYVFLYYYGLERHLLIGNYDLAVDEIIKLVKHYDKGSFKSYATSALLASSLYRKRVDILNRSPFVLDELKNAGLFIRMEMNMDLTADELIKLSSRIGFKNKNYINKKPELFKKLLQEEIDRLKDSNRSILDPVELKPLEKSNELYFANMSIPEKLRIIETPQIIENEIFRKTVYDLLKMTHEKVKNV